MNESGACQGKTDEELVSLSLENADWYGCLMRRYESKLARYIYRISNASVEDIQDLLQEVFLAAYRNLNDFDQTLKFSSWIYRIAHNKVISHYRKTAARADVIDGEEGEKLLAMVSDQADIFGSVNDVITGEVLGKLLKKIDVKYKEVLVLRYLEQKEYGEISDIIKKPVGTVATLLNRAKKRMRALIDEEGIKL
ncbi:MAG: RNA polymerase sigma factor [Patescibacteria group bacterium]